MDLENFNDLTKLGIAVLTLAGMLAGFWRWVLPIFKEEVADRRAVRDVIVGRDPIYDSTVPGKVLAPALPGMGVRMDTLESAVAILATNDHRLTAAELEIAEVKRAVRDLQDGVVERIVARSESAAAWRAVEAVANATPPDETLDYDQH